MRGGGLLKASSPPRSPSLVLRTSSPKQQQRQRNSSAMAASPAGAPQAGKPLVVVGSVNADFVLSVDRLPLPGETVSASTMDLFPGGKGANQAAAAARLGHPTRFIGQCGEDANAAFMRQSLADSTVDCAFLRQVPGCATGSAYIFLQPSGENSIVILGGANQSQWDVSEAHAEAIRGAGAVLLQREIPESVNLRVARVAREGGVPVILDAGGVDAPFANEGELVRFVTVLSPNETELARITGLPTETEDEMLRAAASLLDLMAPGGRVLIKLGARGSMLIWKKEEEGTAHGGDGGNSGDAKYCGLRQAPVAVANVVDTTGAGDCFTAAFAVGTVKGWGEGECLRFASLAASKCIQQKGAMVSLPWLKDMEADNDEAESAKATPFSF
mmetsp:Transcript_14367/g.36252  ORF Transcript_14367/g.36252 Transcript_14367/m.36252 type:complete len:387 (+) Transcript_14367:52-1212(+)